MIGNNASMYDKCSSEVSASVTRLRQWLGGRVPAMALLLGTGWAPLAEALEGRETLAYAQLPAFPTLGVAGHDGQLHRGRLAGCELLVLSGRAHAYEGGRCDVMAGAIETLAAVGVRLLVQTNAAGSLDRGMLPGTVMLVSDHLNLVQASPLVGAGTDPSRFVDLADAYDAVLRAQARRAALAAGLALHEGVYAWMLGPQFETPAEIRMLQFLGAQAVGMSTVPETILARRAGLRVLALSLLTNLGCGLGSGPLSHAGTLSQAAAAQGLARRLAEAIVPALELSGAADWPVRRPT